MSNNGPAQPPAGPAERIPVLDGLRGYAILLVMCTHFFLGDEVQYDSAAIRWFVRVMKSGWIGVDLFFILSGFLITSGLLLARGCPRYFLNFYGRRTLRIFPLYYGVLFVVFVIMPLVTDATQPFAGPPPQYQVWLWLYLSNFAAVFFGSWQIFLGPILHMSHFWSLAVEEHFYLAWPLIVRFLRGRALVGGCLAFILSALICRFWFLWAEGPDSTACYILTFCRMDSLATGALAAVLLQEYGLARIRPVVTAGVILSGVAIAWLFFNEYGLRATGSHLPGLNYSLLAVFFACLLLLTLAAQQSPVVRFLFANRPLVAMGKYSYGLYVYHGLFTGVFTQWVTIAVLRHHVASEFLCALIRGGLWMALACVLAFVSWHTYEKQCLKLKHHFQ